MVTQSNHLDWFYELETIALNLLVQAFVWHHSGWLEYMLAFYAFKSRTFLPWVNKRTSHSEPTVTCRWWFLINVALLCYFCTLSIDDRQNFNMRATTPACSHLCIGYSAAQMNCKQGCKFQLSCCQLVLLGSVDCWPLGYIYCLSKLGICQHPYPHHYEAWANSGKPLLRCTCNDFRHECFCS